MHIVTPLCLNLMNLEFRWCLLVNIQRVYGSIQTCQPIRMCGLSMAMWPERSLDSRPAPYLKRGCLMQYADIVKGLPTFGDMLTETETSLPSRTGTCQCSACLALGTGCTLEFPFPNQTIETASRD